MNEQIKRIVGKRKEPELTFHATAENLIRCSAIQNTKFANRICIPKGVYNFKTHEEADKQMENAILKSIAKRQEEIEKQYGK